MNAADRHRTDETNEALHQMSDQIMHLNARLTEVERLVLMMVSRIDRDYTTGK
jgi:hypothetical protein